ncbi:MAG: MFS transporter [Myxococcota bacterium]|nr:MFS transporter [Myxococcota bacterium]
MRPGQISVLVLLLVGYGSFYLCRANVEAALPLLLREGYDKTHLGLLSSLATGSYAIGKVVLGAAGDKLGGRRLLLVALLGSVLCSFAFGRAEAFVGLVVFAAANRFFQSGGWGAVVHVVSRWFEPGRYGLVMGVLSTSYELGNVVALSVSAVVSRWGWRALFIVNPLLFAVIGGTVTLCLRGEPPIAPDSIAPRPSCREGASARPDAREETGAALPRLFARGAFWVTLAMSMLLTFMRVGFLTWTPTYLYEVSGRAEISGSIVKSAMFPAAGIVAALVVGPVSDRFGAGRRAPIMAASLAVVVCLTLVLAHGGVHDALPASFLIAGIGLFLLGPYSLLAGAVALDLAGKRGTATATGIIDGVGYLGATAAGYVLGRTSDRAGWSAAFDVLAAAAILSTVLACTWSVVVFRRRGGALPAHG